MNLSNSSLNLLVLNNFIEIFKYLKNDKYIFYKTIKMNHKHPYNLKYFENSVWFGLIKIKKFRTRLKFLITYRTYRFNIIDELAAHVSSLGGV